MSLQTALQMEPDSGMCSFSATVLKKSEMIRYTVKGSPREYFQLTVADGTKHGHIRVYQKLRINNIKENKTYTFDNVARKGGNNFWALSTSGIFQTRSILVPQAVQDLAAAEEPATSEENKARDIHAALEATSTSCVRGVIVKVIHFKYKFCKMSNFFQLLKTLDY